MKKSELNKFEVFDLFSEAVFAVEEGRIVYMNASAENMFSEGMKGAPIQSVLPGGELLEDGPGIIVQELQLKGKSYTAMSSKRDGVRIISIRRDAERPTEDDRKAAESIVAPIRNNIAVCKSGIDLLNVRAARSEDDKIKTYLAMMDKSLYSMRRILENFSTLMTPDGRNINLERSSFDIVRLCSDIISTVLMLVENDEVELTLESSQERIGFYGDAPLLERMILNFISNSLKYTPKGGKIKLSVKEQQDSVLLQVSDNGTGMKPEAMASAFASYRRPRDLADPAAGAGMGLAVAREIALRHKGTVVIESSPGVGTRVTARLPIVRPEHNMVRSEPVRYRNGLLIFFSELADVLDYKSYFPEER